MATVQMIDEEFRPSGTPLVSIIVPAYNCSPYIAATLDSVFAQTFKSTEVIVVNGGSPDTQQLEIALQPYRDSIAYIKQENRGVAADRNAGIRAARGEFLAFLDGDDVWLPDYLATQMKFFETTPSLDMVYCDQLYFGDERHSDSVFPGGARRAGTTCMQGSPSRGPVTFESLLTERCNVVTSSTVARRRVIVDCGMFEEKMFRAEDIHMWLRVAHSGSKIAYHKAVLGGHRLHPGSLATQILKSNEAVVDALQHLQGSLPLTPPRRRLVERQIERFRAMTELHRGKMYLSAGEFDKARDSLAIGNAFFRSPKLYLVLAGLRIAPRLTQIGALAWHKIVLKS
jgi:GT2 family glycosyltransferase